MFPFNYEVRAERKRGEWLRRPQGKAFECSWTLGRLETEWESVGRARVQFHWWNQSGSSEMWRVHQGLLKMDCHEEIHQGPGETAQQLGALALPEDSSSFQMKWWRSTSGSSQAVVTRAFCGSVGADGIWTTFSSLSRFLYQYGIHIV